MMTLDELKAMGTKQKKEREFAKDTTRQELGCTEKRRYATEERVQQAVRGYKHHAPRSKRHRTRHPVYFTYYRCNYCGGYHITSK